MKLFLSPHNDDETLFGAFTIIERRPKVVVCYLSPPGWGAPEVRTEETRRALLCLGTDDFVQEDAYRWSSVEAMLVALAQQFRPSHVWAPSVNASHPEHVALAKAAASVFTKDILTRYHTYRTFGQKVRDGVKVKHVPAWTEMKLHALAKYQSQINDVRVNNWFME